jgi:hypothetical protein
MVFAEPLITGGVVRHVTITTGPTGSPQIITVTLDQDDDEPLHPGDVVEVRVRSRLTTHNTPFASDVPGAV